MSPSHASAQRARRRMSTRAIVGWSITAVIVLLVACVVWIGVRALAAKADLESSVSLVSQIKNEIGAGDVKAAQASSEQLATKTHAARDLTGDPIWRAAEIVPLIGPNLTAVREVSVVVAEITDDSITPLAGLAGSLSLESFKPVNGAVPLKPLIAAAPIVTKANTHLQAGLKQAQSIDTSGTVSLVENAVTRLASALQSASQITDTADRAVNLLPTMLGSGGPRNYLVLFQNNAELRSTGGIAGAVALLHAENGAISLVQQASSQDFPHYPAPVLPLSAGTTGVYGTLTGEYIQDVNLTPQFPVAAPLARQMWKQQFGTDVDGVLTMDPVALSYLLKATGPITLATGDQLTSDNAVKLLLSEVYARYSDPKLQDAFFASAAAEVFAKVSSGSLDPKALMTALAKAADEHRVLVWSASAGEQKSLEQTTLAGELPASDARDQRFGVYLNDATGAKMDYYVHSSIGLAQATCRADGRQTYAVEVTLKSTAPADAATSLPAYVIGDGVTGLPAGSVRTDVAVYAPPGAVFVGAQSDGKRMPLVAAENAGRQLSQFRVDLAPGQSMTMQLQFLGVSATKGQIAAQSTPGVYETETHRLDFHCESRLQ